MKSQDNIQGEHPNISHHEVAVDSPPSLRALKRARVVNYVRLAVGSATSLVGGAIVGAESVAGAGIREPLLHGIGDKPGIGAIAVGAVIVARVTNRNGFRAEKLDQAITDAKKRES